MAFNSIVTSFVQAGATGTQTLSGFGFTPKLALFSSIYSVADGVAAEQAFAYTYGAVANTQSSFSVSSYDGGASGFVSARRGNSTHGLALLNASGINEGLATVSFTSDGLSIVWNAVAGTPHVIVVVAIGGSDVVNVDVGILNSPGATGNSAISHSFTPNVILLNAFQVGSSWDVSSAAPAYIMHGWATAGASFCTQSFIHHLVGYANTYVSNDRCIVLADVANVWFQASLVSFASNQTTLNWQTVAGGGGVDFQYIALQVTAAAAGTFTQPTTATSRAVTGVGFRPAILLGQRVLGTQGFWDHASLLNSGTFGTAFGWADTPGVTVGTGHASLALEGHFQSASRCPTGGGLDRTKYTTHCLAQGLANPTLSQIDSHVVSFDSDGFTVLYDHMLDTSQRTEAYLALGPGVAAAGTAYTLPLGSNSYGVTLGTTEGFPRPVSLILTYRR